MTSKEIESILNALDAIAASLPNDFVWAKELRSAYEKSVSLLNGTIHS